MKTSPKQSSEEIIGRKLFQYIKAKDSGLNLFKLDFLKNQMLKLSISNPKLQKELFRFVDVLPTLQNSEQISQYLFEYLTNSNPKFLTNNPLVNKILDWGVHITVKLLAASFICGSNTQEALVKIQELKRKKQDYTLDILGELALSEKEALHYYNEYIKLLEEIPQVNISVKLSALIPQVNALDFTHKKSIIKERLRNIYRLAQKQGSFINVDTEHYAWKELTYEIIRELLMEQEFRSWTNAGIVIQAYLKESEHDLRTWINWAKTRGTPITVRLVKGAYWDYEYAISQQHNWEVPVFTEKYLSDANYEKLTEILLNNHNHLRPALASHNIRSLAHALSYISTNKIDKSRYEFQMLYGMLDSLKDYFSEHGYTIRVYMPYGELIPGMSYLVRRLLENTANDSFLRQGMLEGRDIDELLRNPTWLNTEHSALNPATTNSSQKFTNDPNIDFSKKLNRDRMKHAIDSLGHELNHERLYPVYINGNKIYNDDYFESFNPADPSKILGRISHSTIADCDKAINAAEQSSKKWSQAKPPLRSAVLKLTAQKLKSNRYKFNALLSLEAGKPWLEADGEVSEAIDFLEYYASQAEAMQINKLKCLPGEKNTNHYQVYGVAVIISPWNFPLAIMSGMTAGALVMGNAVIVKPSQQTSIIAHEFLSLLNQAAKELASDYVKGLINFLPGDGKTIGSYLVAHAKTRLIAFTGSNAVGMSIHDIAKQARPTKQVIAEMGGKNAIIIDESADLDEAIPGVIQSSFGYAGQKCSACSRVIIHENIYQQFIERLIEAAQAINIADPRNEACTLPPVIDVNAQYKISQYIELGKQDGTMLLGDLNVPESGYYLSPYIFTDLAPDHKLVQEEIFGPVLVVFKAKDLDHALELANNTPYGLTGAFYSRSPLSIEKVSAEFMVGNLYINRGSTGAIVSRQAFGGLKQSSIGFKAGGPNYLLQFAQEKTITENTMRRGFVGE